MLARIQRGGYPDKFELMRDMALNLFWVNRYMVTMFNKRPTRLADVPRGRDDIYVPILTPWVDGEVKGQRSRTCLPDPARSLGRGGRAADLQGRRDLRHSPQPRDRPTAHHGGTPDRGPLPLQSP